MNETITIIYNGDDNKHYVKGKPYRYVKKIPFDKLNYKEQCIILEGDKVNK